MIEGYEYLALAAIPLYVIIFHIVTYLSIPELWKMDPHLHKSWDKIFQAGLRGEQVSFALTGFGILGLTIMVSVHLDELEIAEEIIVFFSLAFILEVFSAFMFHLYDKYAYQISASILQFGGIFAFLLGFATYFTELMEWSIHIQVLYVIGVVGFLVLSVKELHAYVRYEAKKQIDE